MTTQGTNGGDDFVVETGATVQMLYTKRTMTIYGIEEDEMESIGELNYHHTFWWSLAGIFGGGFLGCLWDISNAYKTTEGISASGFFVSIVILLAAIGSGMNANRHKRRRDEKLQRIKDQSSQITGSP